MHAVNEKVWTIREPDRDVVARLARDLSVDPLLARLLANRGVTDGIEGRRFLAATLTDLRDPLLLRGMDAAVERLCTALRNGEQVCVYGDYDVDGVTGTALLVSFFREVGFYSCYHIPKRLSDGYGLSMDGIRAVAERGARVIVTVDCGISSVAEADLCAALGVDLIITDHHTPGPELPRALAVINPRQPGCSYPFKSLAGVGVAFNLLIALRGRLREEGCFTAGPEPNLRRYLDLVALGTVADVVPLVEENRIFVTYGLKEVSATGRVGLSALKEVAGVAGRVGCGAVGFRLAPRLNAAGRLEDASLGVELLLTDDRSRAAALAAELDRSNGERQVLERSILDEATAMVRANPGMAHKRSIVLASDSWHPGVVGIVASRLVDRFHRPTILIALQDGTGRGSGRSVPALHLLDALSACGEHLEKFGGHRQAAGLSIDEETLQAFVERFEDVCAGLLGPDDLKPLVAADAELAADEVNPALVDLIEALEPFGMGNPEPLFLLRGVTVCGRRVAGGHHLQLRLDLGGRQVDAVGFNLAARDGAPGERVDILFTAGWNNWNGRRKFQLTLKDLKRSGDGRAS
ncbi:single-stranded-DNA-specific exonuclease RecJ [Geobacter sulfurreducens subsp. ethanolicus]|uniref:single-stranded-DNA-specific exonuclease RecJ n=1 Tax=Geobacter sulfurreducens TaxID=35554 RepID=UPI0025743018|nr:single-stranded-DNA-specific exonuclease RecJ [Geobacter sulfurreducens]BEH09403.1 single-stranded-DNA-specific exonuclease RecJ [Geobacter sulfurreducens subsp. ethanolicus]